MTSDFVGSGGYFSNASSVSLARLVREKVNSRRLIDLMVQVKRTNCTEPRDIVYAPLSHAGDVAPGQIALHYRRTLVVVYMDVARVALFHPGVRCLEVLG